MAKQPLLSTKRLQIDKANTSMVAVLAVAAFITVFSLVASKALLTQRGYQAHVISKKRQALAQLKANNQAASQLVNSYKAFVGSSDNIIGGLPAGSGDRDGDNAKIVLDALPSKYDFPALATSLEKILINKNYKLISIIGTDDELNQSTTAATAGTQAVEMPFQVSVSGDFTTMKDLIDILQRSIRPINISKLEITGKDANLVVNITAKTYYQPQKNVNIKTEVVK